MFLIANTQYDLHVIKYYQDINLSNYAAAIDDGDLQARFGGTWYKCQGLDTVKCEFEVAFYNTVMYWIATAIVLKVCSRNQTYVVTNNGGQ